MAKKSLPIVEVKLDKIVGGGQALGTLEDGKKCFVWGALPGETAKVQLTKKKSSWCEGQAIEIINSISDRIEPIDNESYLSTSPWQMMSFEAEQHYKSALIEEAFELHNIVLPNAIEVFSDGNIYNYRNKVEFSWFGDIDEEGKEKLDLAFFRRGTKGKIPVENSALLPENIMRTALKVRDILQSKNISARNLKTLLIRCSRSGDVCWQLYIKDLDIVQFTDQDFMNTGAIGAEIIYSNPKSPASVITQRLQQFGTTNLIDTVLGVDFRYAVEGFFQVNIPVYEQALLDMKKWVANKPKTIDLYSGVGSIGLTIGNGNLTLVEINEHAVREMKNNIKLLDREDSAEAILAASEDALNYIDSDSVIIVDPPRAGLHADVIKKLLEISPERIIYLSCNPVTQARDVELLSEKYGIRHHQGYNFFPRTPHIEHLVVLDLKNN